MNAGLEDMEAIRQEILGLLRQQMEALDSPKGMTDDQVRECYLRQNRVQELRELLQASVSQGEEQEQQDIPPMQDAMYPHYRQLSNSRRPQKSAHKT